MEPTTLAATSQLAYLLFYERCDDQEVQETQIIDDFEPNEENPKAMSNQNISNKEMISIKQCVPPGYCL